MAKITKGFIKNWGGDTLLPITRAELVLDNLGNIALNSGEFEAGKNGSKYGLISVEDLAKIKSTSGSGFSLQDLYEKIGYVNSGLYVNNQPLTFYDTNGVRTLIDVNAVDNTVVLRVANNSVTLDLAEVITPTTTSTIIKSLSVDKYGRITAITEGALTDAELPKTLTDKTIVNGILDGCYTKDEDIVNHDKAIVNKRYVDQAIARVDKVATGALVFGTSLRDADSANNALKNSSYLNHYFKATGTFELSTGDLFDSTGYTGTTFTVKPGDTLIIYKDSSSATAKFIHVPSGDDITTITVARESDLDPVIKHKIGDVKFTFSDVFSVSNPNGGGNVLVSLPKATSSADGYLSHEDYVKFSNYSNSLAVSYEGIFSAADGYKLGTITVGESTYDVYGKNQVSKLELTDGSTNSYNPILKFTETGVDPVSVEVKGINGILVAKNGNSIEISASTEVASGSEPYLSVTDGHKIGVKLGSVVDGEVVNGLTDYNEFAEFRSLVYTVGTVWEEITNDLSNTQSKYYYGSSDLITAISF